MRASSTLLSLRRYRSMMAVSKDTPFRRGIWSVTSPEAYRPFFETDSIDEAKDFAMRLAFDETNHVYVQDTRRDEIVRDFDAPVYRD